MSGVLIDSRDLPELRAVLRAWRAGELGNRRPPDGGQVRTPAPVVVACYETVSFGSTPVSDGNGLPIAYNVTDRPLTARRLQPVDDRVQWIRMLGFTTDVTPPGPPTFQLEYNDQQVTIGEQEEASSVRDKLIGIGLPDDIQVRGVGDILDDGSESHPGWWAVRFPDLPTDSEEYRLLWYDDPDAGVQRVPRLDSYPWWPSLEDLSIWKAVPSTDLIPNFSFVHCSWLWGRGYVADQWECVL